ncbi:hypothetical protein Bbelb_308680 [Branchiostoma belcheri]|nr:hypothetical protein Bbelb_308680 [Branchiostoma belcheri]
MRPSDDPLATEAVQGATLAFESVDNVHGGDRLALGVLGVCDRIADDILEEDLENASGLLVDYRPEIRLTPPRRARRRIAGLVMPWMLSRSTLRPLPPFPRPDMIDCTMLFSIRTEQRMNELPDDGATLVTALRTCAESWPPLQLANGNTPSDPRARQCHAEKFPATRQTSSGK